MTACAFCEIVAGRAPAEVVLEDAETVAFLDARPVFPGHVLLVPREHVETLADLPDALVGPVFRNVQRLARAAERGLGAEGTFVAMNNRVSVPRRKGDGLKGFFWPRQKYGSEEEMRDVAGRLRAALKSP